MLGRAERPNVLKMKPKLASGDEEADRKCIRCQKVFRSSWKGDRVCPRCRWREKESPMPGIHRASHPHFCEPSDE